MRSVAIAAAFLLTLAGTATTAKAATELYTVSGTASGSLAGVGFTAQAFTFSLTGDNTVISGAAGDDSYVIDPLESASFSIANVGSGVFSLATRLGEFTQGIYFSRSGSFGLDIFDFLLPNGAVDLTQSFGPVDGADVYALEQFVGVDTSIGDLTLTASSDVQFSGVIEGSTPVGGVPEPGGWALMLIGIASVGLTLRKGRPVKSVTP
jgi:hypothetical protein